jgi:signal transduction histidine kinase
LFCLLFKIIIFKVALLPKLHHLSKIRSTYLNLPPEIRTTGLYLLFGFLWILFSDKAVLIFTRDPVAMNTLSTFKGWFYVCVTAVLLYLLLRRDTVRNTKYTNELKKAKETAEAADNFKTKFLANISHDLRTPMNAIIGFSELLQRSDIPEQKRDTYLVFINEKSKELLHLFNNLIESSKIHEGQLVAVYDTINISNLFERIYNSHISVVKFILNKDIKLKCELDCENSSATMVTDVVKLEQIINNLVYNALKYTQEGEICLGFSLSDTVVTFFVKDTGIGIPESEQPFIFDRFRQVNVDDLKSGAGIGLSICKAFVEVLGGKIWVESKPGIGSTFYFTLPRVH